jgi:plasmid stabilization system protein ParE
MTDKPLEFHEEAAAEYEAAIDWYFERSRVAASKFAAEVNKALDLISQAPHRWPTHAHGTRRFLLRHFPFAVVYRNTPSAVQIIAMAHGRRRPGYWKGRR